MTFSSKQISKKLCYSSYFIYFRNFVRGQLGQGVEAGAYSEGDTCVSQPGLELVITLLPRPLKYSGCKLLSILSGLFMVFFCCLKFRFSVLCNLFADIRLLFVSFWGNRDRTQDLVCVWQALYFQAVFPANSLECL